MWPHLAVQERAGAVGRCRASDTFKCSRFTRASSTDDAIEVAAKVDDLSVKETAFQFHAHQVGNRLRNFVLKSDASVGVLQRHLEAAERRPVHLDPSDSAVALGVFPQSGEAVRVGKQNAGKGLTGTEAEIRDAELSEMFSLRIRVQWSVGNA